MGVSTIFESVHKLFIKTDFWHVSLNICAQYMFFYVCVFPTVYLFVLHMKPTDDWLDQYQERNPIRKSRTAKKWYLEIRFQYRKFLFFSFSLFVTKTLTMLFDWLKPGGLMNPCCLSPLLIGLSDGFFHLSLLEWQFGLVLIGTILKQMVKDIKFKVAVTGLWFEHFKHLVLRRGLVNISFSYLTCLAWIIQVVGWNF